MPFQKKKRVPDPGTFAFILGAFAVAGVALGVVTGGSFHASVTSSWGSSDGLMDNIIQLRDLLGQQKALNRQIDKVLLQMSPGSGEPGSALFTEQPSADGQGYCGDGVCNGKEEALCGLRSDDLFQCPNGCWDCGVLPGVAEVATDEPDAEQAQPYDIPLIEDPAGEETAGADPASWLDWLFGESGEVGDFPVNQDELYGAPPVVTDDGSVDAAVESGVSSGDSVFCTNGVLEAGEECDDGNQTEGDGCSSVCVIERIDVGDAPFQE